MLILQVCSRSPMSGKSGTRKKGIFHLTSQLSRGKWISTTTSVDSIYSTCTRYDRTTKNDKYSSLNKRNSTRMKPTLILNYRPMKRYLTLQNTYKNVR